MIKHMQTTLVTMGDGTTCSTVGCNTEGEGVIQIFNDDEYHKPGTSLDMPPKGAIMDFPDVAILFRTTKDIDLHIKLLKELKGHMKEVKKEANQK